MKNESGNPYRPALCFYWMSQHGQHFPATYCQGWWWMLPIGKGFHRAATSIAASFRVAASDSRPRPKAEVQQRTGYCTPCTPATSSQPAKKCQAEEKVRIGIVQPALLLSLIYFFFRDLMLSHLQRMLKNQKGTCSNLNSHRFQVSRKHRASHMIWWLLSNLGGCQEFWW